MEKQRNIKKVICFGEVLWDHLPSGRKAGGAPMNVAYHLRQLGIDSCMVSCVGADVLGSELLNFMEQKELPSHLVQITDKYQTSEVIAHISEDNEVNYDIIYPVAWDFIEWKPEYAVLLKEASAFVFGSLAARNKTSQETLFKMLEYSTFNVFDINLRAPHYDLAILEQLLTKTHLLKLNQAELSLLAENLGFSEDEDKIVPYLCEKFKIEEVIVTKGSAGASLHVGALKYNRPIYPIKVVDTVGSGDSFLAGFLAGRLQGEQSEKCLDNASALAAFVTMHAGACPPYSKQEFECFQEKLPIVSV